MDGSAPGQGLARAPCRGQAVSVSGFACAQSPSRPPQRAAVPRAGLHGERGWLPRELDRQQIMPRPHVSLWVTAAGCLSLQDTPGLPGEARRALFGEGRPLSPWGTPSFLFRKGERGGLILGEAPKFCPEGESVPSWWAIPGERATSQKHAEREAHNLIPAQHNPRTGPAKVTPVTPARKAGESFTSVGRGTVHLWSPHWNCPGHEAQSRRPPRPLATRMTPVGGGRSEGLRLGTVPADGREEESVVSVDVCSLHCLLRTARDHQPGTQPFPDSCNKFTANTFFQ